MYDINEEIKLAYDNSGLGDYINSDPQQAIQNILFKAQSFDICRVKTGIKSKGEMLDTQIGETKVTKGSLHAAKVANPGGGVKNVKVDVSVSPYSIYETYESEMLEGKLPEMLLNPGSHPGNQDALHQMVMELKGSAINKLVEHDIWLGNSAQGVDGFVKQATDSAKSIKTGSAPAAFATGAQAMTAVKAVIKKLFSAKPELETEETAMFMSPANFSTWYAAVYKLEGAIDRNTLNVGAPVTNAMVPGTNVRVYSMMGMIGNNNILMGRPENFAVITDLKDESQNRLEMQFVEADYIWQLGAAFKLGTKIIREDEVVITKA